VVVVSLWALLVALGFLTTRWVGGRFLDSLSSRWVVVVVVFVVVVRATEVRVCRRSLQGWVVQVVLFLSGLWRHWLLGLLWLLLCFAVLLRWVGVSAWVHRR
jgi:hypothetical protein